MPFLLLTLPSALNKPFVSLLIALPAIGTGTVVHRIPSDDEKFHGKDTAYRIFDKLNRNVVVVVLPEECRRCRYYSTVEHSRKSGGSFSYCTVV
jgi:hypothetical protein